METDREECYWEIEKFIRLALQANPGALECLWSPLVETCTPLAGELVAMRGAFLSRFVHRTHSGYVLSQFQKLEQDLRNGRGIKWKHAMHLIRLLLTGIAILRDGEVVLRLDRHREQLLAIRRGEVDWAEVDRWRLGLHAELDAVVICSPTLRHHHQVCQALDHGLHVLCEKPFTLDSGSARRMVARAAASGVRVHR